MAILVVTNSLHRPGVLARIARPFPFRGRKRVEALFRKKLHLLVGADGVWFRPSEPAKRTHIYAAQLRALGIKEIRISPEENAAMLLDIIAMTKKLPEGEDITVADLATDKGKIAYATSTLTPLTDVVYFLSNVSPDFRRVVFKRMSSKQRIESVARNDVFKVNELIRLLSAEEVESAAALLASKLSKTSERDGHVYIEILGNMGKRKEPEILEIVDAYYARRKAIEAEEEAKRQDEAVNPDDYSGTGGTPPYPPYSRY